MFKKFFLRDDEEDEVYETVDPVLEQRRKEKFSTPLIYNDDEIVEEKKPEVKKTSVKKSQPLETNYRMSEIISPMSGVKKKYEPEIKPKQHKKVKIKTNSDELIPIISPFYGPSDALEEEVVEKEDLNVVPEEPSVEKNLRNIAKFCEKEQDQLKIIEQRTGEFKLDFHNNNEDSLIDEIDDSMSLDELMSLYEKKFKD